MTRTRKIVLGAVSAIVIVVAVAAVFIGYQVHHGRAVPPARAGTIRVASVGDSITYGSVFTPADRYPDQLEGLLGEGYSVRNFGAIGYTLQKAGDHPYWEHPYFQLSDAFEPQIVLIMLGTNDSKPQNWAGIERYNTDLRALIAHYQGLPGKPRVVLMTPPSAFLVKGRSELPAAMNAEHVVEMAASVKAIGAELGLTVADVHAATAPHPEFFQMDGVHPDGAGQGLIAKTVFDALAAGGAGASRTP